jgi:DNA polymerase-3 subunit gamma/tau
MMATTELHKIPDTILSRSQVFEFKTIPTRAIAEQLRRIAAAEKIEIDDPALALIARAAEGSMRDAQSAFDQVIAFAGQTIAVDDVSTVLGLVGRDLLLDLIEAVIDEDGPRAFSLADRAVESGHDLKLVCRELTRVVRDMMLLSVDPARAGDGELAEDERERLTALSRRFSREDLMRAFDLLAKAEQEIRTASHPRYYFEMVLLRWMHLRKLVPLADLLEQLGSGGTGAIPRALPAGGSTARPPVAAPRTTVAPAAGATKSATSPLVPSAKSAISAKGAIDPVAPGAKTAIAPVAPVAPLAPIAAVGSAAIAPFKDALLAEIRAGKAFFYNTIVAQAQKIEVTEDRVVFTFLPTHRMLREQFEQSRSWLEATAERVAGRRVIVEAVEGAGQASAGETARAERPAQTTDAPAGAKRDLKAEALSSSTVQAVLDVFPAEIRDVEEM